VWEEWIARSTPFAFLAPFLMVLVLLLVIVIGFQGVDHEHDHEHDYEGTEVAASTFAYISR
jgi:hypothetical protein